MIERIDVLQELWDLTDKDGRPNGHTFVRDSREKIPEGMYHTVVEIWVKTSDGRVLLTRRHPHKFNGYLWETTCGSALAGEKVREAAVRELSEEVGIFASPDSLFYLGRVVYNNFITESFCLSLEKPLPVRMQAEEVVDARYVRITELPRYWNAMTEHAREHFKLYEATLAEALDESKCVL